MLQSMLVKFIEERKDLWEEYLDTCVFAYNMACHESTQYSPFELMFGRKAVLPIDIEVVKKDVVELLDEYNMAEDDYSPYEAREQHQKVLEAARNNIIKAQVKQKLYYDKQHYKPGEILMYVILCITINFACKHTGTYSVGAKMLVKDFNQKKRKGGKLDYKWKGPYIVTKSLGRGLYSLKACNDSNDISRINGAHLKQYLSPLHSVSFTFSIAVVLISLCSGNR